MNDTTLWTDFRDGGNMEARDLLLERHLPLVRFVARGLWNQIRKRMDLDDLVSAGTMGLVNAVEAFEPERGLAFSTFATPRIRGAILDHLRKWDHVPRSVRRKQRALRDTREELTHEMGREPSMMEMAEALEIDLETVCRWESDAADAVRVALDAPLPGEGKKVTSAEIIPGDSGNDYEDGLNHQEEVEALKEAMSTLSERERTILSLYYYEGLKMHQIGEILGVTESRVSQIRTGILKNLRGQIGHLREHIA